MKTIKNVNKILTSLRKNYQEQTMLSDFSNKDPFFILIATALSARSRDEVTAKITKKLFLRYPTSNKLAKASISSVEKIIKPIGFYKVKARRIKELARIINKEGMPSDMEGLMRLPGVGHKTAACVCVYAFNKKEIPVDVHVAVVSQRLGWTKYKQPEKIWLDLKEKIPKKYWPIINELFVIHGKNVCYTHKPKCFDCPIIKLCPSSN